MQSQITAVLHLELNPHGKRIAQSPTDDAVLRPSKRMQLRERSPSSPTLTTRRGAAITSRQSRKWELSSGDSDDSFLLGPRLRKRRLTQGRSTDDSRRLQSLPDGGKLSPTRTDSDEDGDGDAAGARWPPTAKRVPMEQNKMGTQILGMMTNSRMISLNCNSLSKTRVMDVKAQASRPRTSSNSRHRDPHSTLHS